VSGSIVSKGSRLVGLWLVIATLVLPLRADTPDTTPDTDSASRPEVKYSAAGFPSVPYLRENGDQVWTFFVFIMLQSAAILALVFNILRRMRSERALAESEARNRTIIRTLPDLVCITDPAGICLQAYAAPATAAPDILRQMRGQSLAAALGTPDHASVSNAVTRTLEENCPQVFECRTTQQPARDYSGRTAPLLVPGSNSPRVLVALRDVTTDKQVTTERLVSERREQHDKKLESLGMMAGGIAHDFNNLLMGISGHAELGLQDPHIDTRMRAYLEAILNAARKAGHLSLQMLAYSGRQFACHTDIDLCQLMQDARSEISSLVSTKVSLRYDCAEGVHAVRGDPELLRQALFSVVENAGEAIGDTAGTIDLEVATATLTAPQLSSGYISEQPPPGDYVALKIHDNGSGIDPDNIERIFDPFFSTKFTGRGLGLAAVLGIIRSHHGTVTVESSPFDGTTINLLIPCAHHHRHAPAQRADPLPKPTQNGSHTILLADDEETVRIVGSRMLRKQGYNTVTVMDGQEAVESLASDPGRYCAAILDVTMPRKDGLAAYREMHKLAPQLPIIMASGYSRDQIMDKFDQDAPPPFLHKPFRLSELARILEGAIKLAGPSPDAEERASQTADAPLD